ncbi:MAG: RNase H family protein [Cyanobacteria bacterium J06638_20]
MTKQICIYTDGGTIRGMDFAAWAFVVPRANGSYFKRSGILKDCSNNGAEVMACGFSLNFVANHSIIRSLDEVLVFTDSPRPFDGLNGMLEHWESNGWRSKNKRKKGKYARTIRELSEKDYWIYLLKQKRLVESVGCAVTPVKVKSHSNNYWNDCADRIVKRELARHCQRIDAGRIDVWRYC